MVLNLVHGVVVGKDFENVLTAIEDFVSYARKWQSAV
jgi:hypothetical protein